MLISPQPNLSGGRVNIPCCARLQLAFVILLAGVALASNAYALDLRQNKNTIANFDFVSPVLSRGAKPSPLAIKQLHDAGFKTVIDLRLSETASNRERMLVKSLGMNYFHLPMGYLSPSCATIVAFLDIVCNPNYQPTFLHCRQGADRTGTLVGIYRLLVQGWSWDETYKDMRHHNFKPWLIGLKNSVAAFQDRLVGIERKVTVPMVNLRQAVQSVIDSKQYRLLAHGYNQPGP